MADLTSQQQTELAALRRALAEGDYEVAAATIDILLSLNTPLLPLLDVLGSGYWDEEDEEGGDFEGMLVQLFQGLDESAIPELATYVMEEDGPDILVDMAAERLDDFSEDDLLKALRAALRHPDERIREGVRDYLDEWSTDSEDAEAFLDEFEDFE